MIKIIFSFLLIQFTFLNAGDGTCKKCKVIREENKKKVNPYKYYEDYLKAKKELEEKEANSSNEEQTIEEEEQEEAGDS